MALPPHTHNGLVLERPEPRCTSMSAALDVGHSRLDTFLRCYQGCLPSCSLRSTFHFRRQLSGTGRSGGQETNNRIRILRSFIIVAKRQPYQTQIQVYSLYYNKAYTPYFTQTNMCNIGHVGGGGHVTLPVIINLTAIQHYYKSHL